jgi:hypothetical protein
LSSPRLLGCRSTPCPRTDYGQKRIDQDLGPELVSQEIGFGAMSAALLKQIIAVLLRRSISSMQSWAEGFSMLRDPQIARAFSEMVHSLPPTISCWLPKDGARQATLSMWKRPATALRDAAHVPVAAWCDVLNRGADSTRSP